MAPVPQEVLGSGQGAEALPAEGERVVISGMSGLYPNALHVADLADILYNKINPVTSDNSRYEYTHPEVSQYVGKVPGLQYFDAQFFMVHYRLANSMDAMARKVLEQAYQAIYDAGVSPDNLSGKKVGVYIGSCYSETEKACFYDIQSRSGSGIAGCNKSMFANRISYWLNAKGPSMAVDQACSSSTAALEMAYNDIMRGECEAAVVGGANLCLHPQSLVHYGRIVKLSKDGKTKSFNEDAEGCAKSEAINVIFLQKAKHAIRIYAEIVFIKTQFTSLLDGESGPRYGFSRNPKDTIKFLKQFYDEAKVPPQAVEFVEAWGSAVPESDKAELEAIEDIFCHGRSDPLLVGSVMSNIGYGEAASGITAITKVLLGYHTGEMAANLHCSRPRRDVAALRDGRMRVATEHARLRRSYVAVNGLSVTGVNSHVLLHGHYKPKDRSRYKSTIPHLVLISGRQDSAVKKVFDNLKSRPIDPEELALLHNVHLTRISGNLGRGFSVLGVNDLNETVTLGEQVSYFDDVKRPLWFVYSGMGSQWAGMGEHLMRIPVFAAAIQRCHQVLQPKDLDIVHIITTRDKTIFDNILHSFVGIAAIQIGLTDVLRKLGIVPDKIIGHSVGELGCAYADGCFTAEEMILSAYSRGLVSMETPFIRGAMAAVGIGYQQIISMCPPDIEVACHNSADSCTITGPADKIHEFVDKLVATNIFAKEVPCSNIAYHSRYIADAGPGLLKYLKEVIKCPKRRSERWISTSVPMDRWDEESAKYSSAEYHTNNLLRPVLFEESSRLVPANAVLVEVAPHGLLQAILKRSLPATCHHIPLTRRGHSDNALFVLIAIGKLYINGFNPNVQALYPKIEFPVSTGTPMLSHLVEWAHNEKWRLPIYSSARRKTAAALRLVISLHDDEHAYLAGHVIKGQILYPCAAVLVAVWDTLAMTRGAARRQLPVQFRQVALNAQPVLHERRQLRLTVALHRSTGRFEVMDDIYSLVASGFIDIPTDYNTAQEEVQDTYLDVSSKEIYNNFNLRGFNYRDSFKSINSVNFNITEALVMWRDNWVTFLDGMIQVNLLRHSLSSLSRPSFIGNLIIDPEVHCKNKNSIRKATVEENYNVTRCGGILMENIKFHDLPVSEKPAALRVLKFVPHYSTAQFDFATVLHMYVQIVTENIDQDEINIVGLYDDPKALSKLNEIKNALEDASEAKIRYNRLSRSSVIENHDDVFPKVNLAIVFNMATDDQIYQLFAKVLSSDAFVINIEDTTTDLTKVTRSVALNQVVCRHSVDSGYLELNCWQPTRRADLTKIVTVNSSSDFSVISDKQDSILPHQEILVLTTHPAPEGLKEYLNDCRNIIGCKFRLVMSNNGNYGGLDAEALKNVKLAVNVFENDVLGGDYFVPLQDITRVSEEVTLRSSFIGQLESVYWEEASPGQGTGILIKVQFAGLNDLDAKRAAGIIPFDTNNINKGYGMDFSGVTESGERVMGLVASGAVSSSVQACPELLWPVPEHWSLEDAATVPLAYCLAYYCLTIRFPLYGGERVLVHEGAGALGQAAITIALALDCEVFTTVGDVRKKNFLLNMFPALKAENIGNSRDISFCDMVLSGTNGKGVNLAICNLQGELKNATLKCVGFRGVTIDVAQIPNRENYYLGMDYLWKERFYVTVNFSSIFNENGKTTMKRLQRLVCEGIARGWVRPLSRAVCGGDEAARALRLLASANQRGRVLLRLRTATDTHREQLDTPPVLPRIRCSSDQCHVIISDHEHLGQHLADKLVSRGVRKLRLYSTLSPEDFKFKIREWQSAGVQISSEALCSLSDVPKSFIEGCSLEPVEGIYIVITKETKQALATASFVEKMDMVSRKILPDVKYFAVINSANSIGAETCMSRDLNQFAGTMIKLPEVREVCVEQREDTGQITCNEAAAVVERALCTSAPVLTTSGTRQPRPSLLQQLAHIAGVTITEDTEGTATLSDLGMEPVKLNNVCIFLRDTHNVFLSLEDIQSLTVQRLKYMDDTLSKTDFEDDKGLKTLFSYVDSDELLATTEMVFLPTLANYSTMRADEFNVNETHLCIVPGVEGHHARFETLCERLQLPALVLQPGLHLPHETAAQTARRYAKFLLEKAGLKTNFYLLGYESGVLVALELAAVLEDYGLTGTVFCLGLPPSEFARELRQQLRGLETEEALQDAVVRHMFGLMTGAAGGGGELGGALRGATSWDEKVEAAVQLLLGRVPHSAQYARQLIEAALIRLAMLLRHDEGPVRALRSRLVLLQPRPGFAPAAALQPHSQQPVTVHALRAPLAQATQDLRCAAIINSYLDESVLQTFKNKNHCESYLLNADSFISPI